MKKKNKIILLLIILSSIFIFTSCNLKVEKGMDNISKTDIETIYNNDEKIKGNGSSYSIARHNYNIINNIISGKYKYFSGLYDLVKIKSKGINKVKCNVDIESDIEDFKIVLISPEKEITILGEGNGSSEELVEFTEGESYLKMVGKGGKGKYYIEFEENNNIETILLDND